MTEVFYLSSAPSPSQFDALREALKPEAQSVTYGMAEASFKFHGLLQRGLLEDPVTRVHSVVGRAATPQFHRGSWWGSVTEQPSPRLRIHHLAFPNRRGPKQIWLAGSFALEALRWRIRTRKAAHRVLIADAAYITALPLALSVLRGHSVRKVAIFADLYSFMAPVEDAGVRSAGLVRSLMRRVAAATYSRLDGFILLTEAMNPVVNPGRKPYIVMEGVVDSQTALMENSLAGKSTKARFLYAGALRREYGVGDLVDGFRALPDRDIELHIYGGGDFATELTAIAAEDERVVFHGLAPLATVVEEELAAWVLVNPRPTGAEFTKYSFPSKNMEYLASGTAVLTTRLPGMPAEYHSHVLLIDHDGPEAISRAMAAALTTPLADLHERGLEARSWVQAHKNESTQAARIMTLSRGL